MVDQKKHSASITQDFEHVWNLGSGAYAIVDLYKCLKTQELVAIKMLNKQDLIKFNKT